MKENYLSELENLKRLISSLENKILNLNEKEKEKNINNIIKYEEKEDEDKENLTGRIYTLGKKIEDQKYIYQYKYHRKFGKNIDLRCQRL